MHDETLDELLLAVAELQVASMDDWQARAFWMAEIRRLLERACHEMQRTEERG